VECVAFHPKRPRLASAGNHYEEDRFRGEAKLWDVTHAPEFRVLRNGGMVGGTVAFDPDGTRLAFGTSWSSLRPGGPPTDSHTVNVVDLTGAGPPLSGEGHTTFVRTFAFSSDKKTLLSLDQGGTVRVWDLTARPMTSTSLEKVAAGVSPLAIAPDGRSFAHAAADNTVIVRALANGNPLRTLSGHTGRVACLTFAPDGARLVTGSDDGTIRVWDLDAKASTVLVGHTKGVSGVALVPSGRLFSCSTDLTICEWDVTNAKQVRELGRHTQGTPHLSASADGRRLVSHDWYTIKVWDLETNLETVTLQQHSLINSVALAPDGKRLATLSGTEIRLWPGKP
jgi:WD40 repeat protein